MTPDVYGVLDGPVWMSEEQAESLTSDELHVVNEHATMSYLLFVRCSNMLSQN